MPDAGAAGAIVKTVTVPLPPDRAFRLWVDRIDAWWPKNHTRSRDPGTTIIIERKRGGRFYERTTAGEEHEFGAVTLYEPPHRLVYHWYLGSSAESPTQVDVRFTAVGDAGTRIDVEQRGRELIGDLWVRRSPGFERAWGEVLARYEQAAAAS